jgi:putative endonuclease
LAVTPAKAGVQRLSRTKALDSGLRRNDERGRDSVEKDFYVYMLASRRNGTLYVGVTSDLRQRIWQHRTGAIDGFSHWYGVCRLVWYERHESAELAILREKRIKEWKRAWKLELIESSKTPIGVTFMQKSVFKHMSPRRKPWPRASGTTKALDSGLRRNDGSVGGSP